MSIEGVDSNLCCGTHVSSSSQLQVIKLMSTESKKGKHWLYFLVGKRVTNYLRLCQLREKSLTKILNNAPEEHVELVDKMQKSLKVAQKSNSNLLKEIASFEVQKFKDISPKPLYCIVHRREGDSDFISTFLKELDDNASIFIFYIIG